MSRSCQHEPLGGGFSLTVNCLSILSSFFMNLPKYLSILEYQYKNNKMDVVPTHPSLEGRCTPWVSEQESCQPPVLFVTNANKMALVFIMDSYRQLLRDRVWFGLLPNSRFAKLPSPAIDWKIWKALYSHGWSVLRLPHFWHSDVTLAFEDALF